MEKAARKAAFSNSWRFGDMQEQGPHQSLQGKNITAMADGQVGFQLSEETLALFDKYLSVERLAAYSAQARGDRQTAIRLYERNTELSEALYGVVQGLEVSLRNAIHNTLTAGLGSPEWYDMFALQESERRAIDEAKTKIQGRPAEINPSRVVAELSFSFWVRLASHGYEDSLWFKYLHRIFPIRVRRKHVHDRLINLKTLRNRIAHHERIINKRDLQKDYSELLETIGWVSPIIKAWVEHTNCFQERFAKRIPQKSDIV